MPLQEFASFHWDDHTRKGAAGGGVAALAFGLLDGFDEYTGISAQLSILRYRQDRLLDIVYYGRGYLGDQHYSTESHISG